MRWRSLGAVWLSLACVACGPTGHRLRVASAALDRAAVLDVRLEAAEDPRAVEQARDAALAEAGQLYDRLLAREPDLPEALLGQASVVWLTDRDLAGAFERCDRVVAQLEAWSSGQLARRRPGGLSGSQILAQACAERASYLLSRYLEPDPTGPPHAAPPTVPSGPLEQAIADLARATDLDPQPKYEFLRHQAEQLRQPPTPLDPGRLGVVPAGG